MIAPMSYNPARWGWRYGDKMGLLYYHPGEDFNGGNYASADLGMPIWASTDSVVEYSGFINGWGYISVLYSRRYDRYFRYAHMRNVTIKKGDTVKEGEQIGECAGTNKWNKPKEDYSVHLHYDIPKIKLSNWGKYTRGMTLQQIKDTYENPLEFISRIAKEEAEYEVAETPSIVIWAQKHGIITKWELPYKQEDIKQAYIAYKTGYLVASNTKRKKYFTLLDINKEMDESINNF